VASIGSVMVLHLGGAKAEQTQWLERHLEAALTKQPESLPLRLSFAELRDLQGRYADARSLYRRILEQDRQNVVALNNLAWLLAFEKGNEKEALQLVNSAIAIAGSRPHLLDSRAMVYLSTGNVNEAIADLRRAVVDGSKATRHFHLAQAYALAKDRPAAVKEWKRALSLGLTVDTVHPLERPAFQRLHNDLGPS
jgi:Tfp pilus assembly protein PilF